MRLRVLFGALGGALALSALVVPVASATPAAPTSVGVAGSACSGPQPVWAGVPSANGTSFSAFFPDPDGGSVHAQAQWWPADDPTQVHTVDGGTAAADRIDWVDIPTGQLADNSTYSFQLRGTDSSGPGPWTPVCTFRTDFVAPTSTPTVTATGYQFVAPGQPSTPLGGTGEPGTIVLDAHGDTQVTGFWYGASGAYAAADHPGGTATVTVVPELSGKQQFTAETADQARNSGPPVTFDYQVADNRPQATCTPDPAYVGVPRQCTFSPATGSTDVAAYTYWIVPDDQYITVPAGPDGTATATITPTGPYDTVNAEAVLRNGYDTEQVYDILTVEPGAPTLDAPPQVTAGAVVRVPVHAVLPGSVSATYQWDDDPAVTIPLTFGTATITIPTPDVGSHSLKVHTTTARGQSSADTTAYLTVSTG